VQGFIYGATRGMAESQIMALLIGQDKKKLETAGFIWMAAVEAFALTMAFGLSPYIRDWLGADLALGIIGGLMLTSLFFFRKIRMAEQEEARQEKKGEEPSQKKGTEERLPLREYIPYVASTFLHFSFYSLFAGVFALNTFANQFMTDRAMGSYDSGSLVISLIAGVPALLASLDAASQAPRDEKAGDRGKGLAGFFKRLVSVFDKVPLKAWFGLGVLGAGIYLWTGMAGWSFLGLAAAAVLGALVTVNRTRWMSSYLSRLKPERHPRVIAVLNSVSVGLSLLPFAVISAGSILGIAVMPLLTWTVAATLAAMAAALVLTRQPRSGKA